MQNLKLFLWPNEYKYSINIKLLSRTHTRWEILLVWASRKLTLLLSIPQMQGAVLNYMRFAEPHLREKLVFFSLYLSPLIQFQILILKDFCCAAKTDFVVKFWFVLLRIRCCRKFSSLIVDSIIQTLIFCITNLFINKIHCNTLKASNGI